MQDVKSENGTGTCTNQSLKDTLGFISFSTRLAQKDGTVYLQTPLSSTHKTILTRLCSKQPEAPTD